MLVDITPERIRSYDAIYLGAKGVSIEKLAI